MKILSLFTHPCVASKHTLLYVPCTKGDCLKNVHAALSLFRPMIVQSDHDCDPKILRN